MMAKTIDVDEFDRKFDDGESIIDCLDLSTVHRTKAPSQRVNVDFPAPMLNKLDVHARNRGVTRQALIKMWLADRLEMA
jgi:CopG antitoxin of type II toxin-antitoxin system